ncbi:transporter [Flavobacterium magnum]|uniref:Transporter n=1 Tax=Flavobacterium magnum TaxID=2162713 RepID=A0A2S0REE5_9FLAO|nr:AEC family transporter [Flavobacterium magnum]AWA29995.1 transporter [Flavobacterium magnum]
MENILLIFICLFVGLMLQRVRQLPAQAHKVLNLFVIYVSLPALALYYIPKIVLGPALLYPLGVAWIGFGFSFLFFRTLGQWLKWPRRLTGCLIIVSGLGNTSFVGFPVIQALYGEQGLQTAIIVDQPGSFVVMATLGIITAMVFSGNKPDLRTISMKILIFPPFVAFVLAAVMNLLNTDFPTLLQQSLQKLGATVTPIALVSVGLQLTFDVKSRHWRFLSLGLLFKLFLTPALIFILYRCILGEKGMAIDVSVMEAAMAPMITGAIVASGYGLKPKLSSMMIGIGIPLSFLTLCFWHWILSVA